jgi:hypothetical protein
LRFSSGVCGNTSDAGQCCAEWSPPLLHGDCCWHKGGNVL